MARQMKEKKKDTNNQFQELERRKHCNFYGKQILWLTLLQTLKN